VPRISDAALEAALMPLRGRILQRAPIYSALKQGGERLYAMARKGLAVEAPEREVEVLRLDVVARGDDWVRLHVECGSGTYIRSLVRDLGEALGCGAHVVELRRLWVDPFRDPVMATLEEIQTDAATGEDVLLRRLLPVSAGLAGFLFGVIESGSVVRFQHGQAVGAESILSMDEAGDGATVAVTREVGTLLGLARVHAGGLQPQRLFRTDATV
jgi:tRNA pseudouridine55 synthase